jgi:hypothetical protein
VNPSASKIADVFACSYPFRPDVELVPDVTGPAAMTGNAIDELVTATMDGVAPSVAEACRRTGAVEVDVEARWPHLRDWMGANLAGAWSAQLWMIYDARTDRTRVVSRDIGRKTKRLPLEVSCIVDLMSQTGPDEATVYDVKTGKPSGAKPEQLATLALAASRWFGVSLVRTGFVFAHKDGVHVEPFSFSAEDLDDHAAKLETYLLEVPTSVPTPGDGCRWCRVKECAPGDAHRKRMGWRRKS